MDGAHKGPQQSRSGLLLVVAVLAVVLTGLFFGAFLPGNVLFSNDGPLGAQNAESHRVPGLFKGAWEDLNSIGFHAVDASPNITAACLLLMGPLGYSKFFAAFALFVLGLGAGTFFRAQQFSPAACILGSLAAVLNSEFFSVAAWGVASQAITMGMIFFALAALADTSGPRGWLRLILAGLAVGMAVSEGADVGAIFSLYVAAYVVYKAWVGTGGSAAQRLARGFGRVAVIALFAGFLAAQTISVLVGTQIKGVAGAQQDTQSKWERWDWATQWSLPKREALGLAIPGLFGYRMDTPLGLSEGKQDSYRGGEYWGFVGMDPSWYRYWSNQGPKPPGAPRGFSGGGIYAGVLVLLIGLWAALQSLRKNDSAYSPETRRLLWFWIGVFVISLPLSFGRFAPFYQIVYALPYFSTIRNPGKFLFPLSWAIIVLFAYGVNGLWRRYMETPTGVVSVGALEKLKLWWRETKGFDKKWTLWCLAALGASAVGWLIYASSGEGMVKYLQELQYDPRMAAEIASFSAGQVGRFVLFFAAAIFLMLLLLSGIFSGHRAKWGAVLLGIFVVIDLGRANQPWVIVWDYQSKYANDPVVEMLSKKPYEHRVATLPRWFPQVFQLPQQTMANQAYVSQYYNIEWAQHHFLYYNIQSLDLIQMPRMPEDLLAYEMNFTPRSSAELGLAVRKWELTNTRYLIGAADFLDVLNRFLDPAKQRFRIAERFLIVPREGITEDKVTQLQQLKAVTATNGPFAVFDFTGALPRAQLYSKWDLATNDAALVSSLQTNILLWNIQQATNGFAANELKSLRHIGTNDYLTLKKLASPEFEPEKTVLLASPLDLTPSTNSLTPADAGTVVYTGYGPKDVILKAEVKAPSVLLLNDRYEENWRVFVDGKPERLLRCNYIMRGVQLQPGTHTVEFRFRPPMKSFYVSVAGVVLGVLLSGVLLAWRGTADRSEFETREPARPNSQPEAAKRNR